MKEKRGVIIIGVVIIAIAFIFSRIQLFWGRTFPLGDGGLFYTMVEQMKTSLWPTTIEYNGQMLPFAYPPLGFWIARILLLLPISQLSLFIYLPLLYNALFIAILTALLWFLSNRSVMITTLCTVLLILAPQTMLWLTFGGGVVRGLGSIFFALTLYVLVTKPNKMPDIIYGLFPAFALLTHPEWGIHSLLVFIFFNLSEKQVSLATIFRRALPISIIAFLYIFRILLVNHTSAYISAILTVPTTGNYIQYLSHLFLQLEFPPYPLMGITCGLLLTIFTPKSLRYNWLLIHFTLVILVIHRNAYTYLAIEGILLSAAALPYLRKNFSNIVAWSTIAVITLFTIANYTATVQYAHNISLNNTLSLPQETTFLSITPSGWYTNTIAEWQPALTSNISVLTVQGTEWQPRNEFRLKESQDEQLSKRIYHANQSVIELLHSLRPHYIVISPETLAQSPEISKDITAAGYTLVLDMQQGYVILGKLCAENTCQAATIDR